MAEDYCELCDLPLSTCIHGRPPPPPPVAPTPAPRASAVRTRRVPGSTGAAGRAGAASPPEPRRAPSRVMRQEALRPHILAVLHDAGGELETETVLARLAERMDDELQERDRQVAPSGEVRWHTAARKERKAMIDEGLVVGARPGVWALTPRGTSQG